MVISYGFLILIYRPSVVMEASETTPILSAPKSNSDNGEDQAAKDMSNSDQHLGEREGGTS